jgi:hypothetical protein
MSGAISWDFVEHATGGRQGVFHLPCPVCAPHRPAGYRQARKVLTIWRSEDDFASYNCVRCIPALKGWVKPDAEPDYSHRGKLRRALDDADRQARQAAQAARDAAEAQEKARRSAWAEFTFFSASDIAGTPPERYLQRRGVTPGDDLRFSPFAPLSYADQPRTMPGMIGAVRDDAGAIIGCHITYLDAEARKLDRKMFGRVAGGAIRLAPIGPDGHLAVAEGIETARSFQALYGTPTWAALSAPGIEAFALPPGLQRLVIAADADEHGRGLEAAQRLAKRAAEHCEVVIALPKVGDWADELLRRRERVAA